ncbi:MAG: hypothetical protein H6718_01520 [Polyangiaceae bacterium]|nr:hypothetical protein [Myxococcales bacterium]MCB9584042.1 hypothetical protein [Polyangiaceae bacterium]
MSLQVSIGLESHYIGREDEQLHRDALVALIETKLVVRVCDFIGDGIYEAWRRADGSVGQGWLDDPTSKRVRDEYAALEGTSAEFEYDALAGSALMELGLPDADIPVYEHRDVKIPTATSSAQKLRATSLETSGKCFGSRGKNWNVARALVDFAQTNFMILHSA